MPSIVCLLILAAAAQSTSAEPTAIVHIGPPKTATTHFQAMLVKYNSQYLSKAGFSIWPELTADGLHCKTKNFSREKQMAHIALIMRNLTVCPPMMATMQHFMKRSLASNTSIILSSEQLWEKQ